MQKLFEKCTRITLYCRILHNSVAHLTVFAFTLIIFVFFNFCTCEWDIRWSQWIGVEAWEVDQPTTLPLFLLAADDEYIWLVDNLFNSLFTFNATIKLLNAGRSYFGYQICTHLFFWIKKFLTLANYRSRLTLSLTSTYATMNSFSMITSSNEIFSTFFEISARLNHLCCPFPLYPLQLWTY